MKFLEKCTLYFYFKPRQIHYTRKKLLTSDSTIGTFNHYMSSANKSDLDMVDFAAHFTIHAITIGSKILHFNWKVLSLKSRSSFTNSFR